ncbi:MAG: hypothetical protein HN368_18845 [Spirochaetales bacterium]|nr:hypothetical protein [Spirochaetales bacterium]
MKWRSACRRYAGSIESRFSRALKELVRDAKIWSLSGLTIGVSSVHKSFTQWDMPSLADHLDEYRVNRGFDVLLIYGSHDDLSFKRELLILSPC